MACREPIFHEHVLHWIWESLHFRLDGLRTACGLPIEILDAGERNRSDGPDFKDARLQVGNLRWCGDIEIHWKEEDWMRHGHQNDANYNGVVLHVVYHKPEGGRRRAVRKGGTVPYLLAWKPHISQRLHVLAEQSGRPGSLPCQPLVSYISEEAFQQQVEQAHREYFVEKIDALTRFYEPGLAPSKAWKGLLILGLFDALGISLNREPMVRLGRELIGTVNSVDGPGELKNRALKRLKSPGYRPRWNYKGCRPANRPAVRVLQGCDLMWRIGRTDMERWFREGPGLGRRLIRETEGLGKGRGDIIYGTVMLPSIYILGSLFHHAGLKQRATGLWKKHTAALPEALLRPFKRSGLPYRDCRGKLGIVHQLKYYCEAHRCMDCEVMKTAILA